MHSDYQRCGVLNGSDMSTLYSFVYINCAYDRIFAYYAGNSAYYAGIMLYAFVHLCIMLKFMLA